MPDNLTTLMARVQALLLDDGTQFSTATLTAAVREALTQFNNAAPIFAGTLIDTVEGDHEYSLSSSDFERILDVFEVLYNDDPQDFVTYYFDNSPFIRLHNTLPAGTATLDVRFSQRHIISGLDSEVESTLTTDQDQVLVDGACATACLIRAADRVETVNVNDRTPDQWRSTGQRFAEAFRLGLLRYQRRRTPKGNPDTRATTC